MAGRDHPRGYHAQAQQFRGDRGIIAAHTTSIPEAPASGRNWDYRYCWLRDAYFVVKALNRIGATQTMEDFITFILGIAANNEDALRPVYSVVPTASLDEKTAPALKGYRGDGPVRVGNAAAGQWRLVQSSRTVGREGGGARF